MVLKFILNKESIKTYTSKQRTLDVDSRGHHGHHTSVIFILHNVYYKHILIYRHFHVNQNKHLK